MAIDPAALKADILAEASLSTAWAEGDNATIVRFYAGDSGNTAAKTLPASELAGMLRSEAATLKVFQAKHSATATIAGAAELFLQFAFGGGTIDRTDSAFVAAVAALVPAVLSTAERDTIRDLFLKPTSRGVDRFGEEVTRDDVRAARKV